MREIITLTDEQRVELEKINEVEQAAWKAYEDDMNSGVRDPRFLEVIGQCIDMRCRLLGLYAPTKKEVTLIERVSTWEGPDETAGEFIWQE